VIRGNYKLLVLGRSDDVTNAVGMDMSGGQLDSDGADIERPTSADVTANAMAGLNVTWEWKKDSDNNFRWHVTTLTGNAAPAGPAPINGVNGTLSNPSVTTRTWAYDVWSETYANTVMTQVGTEKDNTSHTNSVSGTIYSGQRAYGGTIVTEAQSQNDNTTTITSDMGNVVSRMIASNGSIENTARAPRSSNDPAAGGNITNTNWCMGTLENVNFANENILNLTLVPATQESFQYAGFNLIGNSSIAQLQIDLMGAEIYGQICGAIINEMAAGINISNWNGVVVDCHQGIHIDNHAGVHVDNHSGIHLDCHAGGHIDDNDGTKIRTIMGTMFSLCTAGTAMTEAAAITMATSEMHF
jgi:hypothetical protein